jgi:UDP-N-acetylmuramoylalanine--D-glutamate ligase
MNILVIGFGISGQSAHQFLTSLGHTIIGFDDRQLPDEITPFKSWDGIDEVFISPGIPFESHNCHPMIQQAKQRAIPIQSDMDWFFKYHQNHRIIGVTGTNGKSTTTALIHHMLNDMGVETAMGGNIGVPVLSLPMINEANGIYVVELSSFQLALSHNLHFEMSVWCNISMDHLEIHGTMDNYINAKKKILNNTQCAIMEIDDHYSNDIYQSLTIPKISISHHENTHYIINNNQLMHDSNNLMNWNEHDSLVGDHNAQNMAMCFAVGMKLGFDPIKIKQSIVSFKGLKHRLQKIKTINNVTFFNDSKATSAMSTEKALCVLKNVYWIVGGKAKTDGIEPLHPYFNKIKKAYIIGGAQHRFSETLSKYNVSFECVDTLENAVTQSYNDAINDSLNDATILLSPACASYDQFKNFEHRGDVFCELVERLTP